VELVAGEFRLTDLQVRVGEVFADGGSVRGSRDRGQKSGDG
jgi:hypothetical protein